nr:hypothetical protein [Desulfobacterales bacterium]
MFTKLPLYDGLQWLMFLRALFTTLLLGSTIIIQYKESHSLIEPPMLVLYALIISIHFLTLIYTILINKVRNIIYLAYVQVGLDTLLVTFLIYATGSIASLFSFLYLIVIVYGSILLYRKGSLIMAAASSFQYSLMIGLEYFGLLVPFYGTGGVTGEWYEINYVLYKIALTVLACFTVAYLSSYLSEEARKTKEELRSREEDLEQLEAFNACIVRSMESGLLTLNNAARITSFNQAAQSITGFDRK